MWGRVPTPSLPPSLWTGQLLLPILQEILLGRDAPPPPPTPHPLVLPLLFRSPLRGLILQIETSQFWVRVEVRSQAQGIWNHSPCVPTFLPRRGEV